MYTLWRIFQLDMNLDLYLQCVLFDFRLNLLTIAFSKQLFSLCLFHFSIQCLIFFEWSIFDNSHSFVSEVISRIDWRHCNHLATMRQLLHILHSFRLIHTIKLEGHLFCFRLDSQSKIYCGNSIERMVLFGGTRAEPWKVIR